MKRTAWTILLTGALLLPVSAQNYDEGDDPDHGVARLSLLNGDVTVRRGDTGEVVAGDLNAPLVELDHVLTGPGSRAEVQFDWANMIRLGPVSEVRIGELRDGSYFVQVAEGTTTFRVLRDATSNVEISTPTISVRPVEKGIYRITVRPDGATEVTVRSGQAEIFTPQGSEILRSGKMLQARGTPSNPEYMIVSANGRDDWDKWNEDRDRDLERSQSTQYTSRSIYGVDDLDPYGRWVYDPPYGNVWVPSVNAGWAPYRDGRWSYINYYGWSWISSDPWGWAPYHYGSWYSSPYGWAWYPGAVQSRYYWRPALVTFFGWGSGSFSIGVGRNWNYANIGWVPLAPYERYRPWYGRGGNTTIVNVTNVNIVNGYRNARQFNGRDGVTGIRASNFGNGRVTNANYLRATNADLSRAGQVNGRVPFEGTQQSRRFSDRAPAPEVTSRAGRGQDRQFASRATTPSSGNDRGNDRARSVTPTQATNRAISSAPRAAAPAAPSDGWRRFEGGADRAANTRPTPNTNARPTTSTGSSTSQQNSGFRRAEQPQATQPARRSVESAPAQSRTPVERSRPSVQQERRAAPVPQARVQQQAPRNEVRAAPRSEVRSAPQREVRSAPAPSQSRAAQSAPAPSRREGGGGGGGSRGNSGGDGGGGRRR